MTRSATVRHNRIVNWKLKEIFGISLYLCCAELTVSFYSAAICLVSLRFDLCATTTVCSVDPHCAAVQPVIRFVLRNVDTSCNSIAQNYRIDFDDIWQKYSENSRIEFACFSFHVGLFFINFLSFKPDIEKLILIILSYTISNMVQFLRHSAVSWAWISVFDCNLIFSEQIKHKLPAECDGDVRLKFKGIVSWQK